MTGEAAESATVVVEPPAPSVRVEIASGGHQVVVEAPEPLTTVASTALEMWKATDDPRSERGEGSLGFQVERADGPLPADLTLPDRLRPDEWGRARSNARGKGRDGGA